MSNEGWTQTPNFILDNMSQMKPAVFKICMAVVRQTGGYIDKQGNRKEWDRLSTSRLEQLTGLSNRAVIDAVEEAIEQGWIERRPSGQSFEYRVQPMKKVHRFSNETYEKSSQVEATYEKSSQATYEKSSQVPMKKVHTQKKDLKENKKKVPSATRQASKPLACPTAEDEAQKHLVKKVLDAYVELRGKNGVNYGKEGAWAKRIAQEGADIEMVKACYLWLKQDKFYEFKPVSLAKIYENLPEFKRYIEKRGGNKAAPPEPEWILQDLTMYEGGKYWVNVKTGEKRKVDEA